MNIGKWVKTQKRFFILGKEIRPKGEWKFEFHSYEDGLGWRWKCSMCGVVAEDKRGMNYCPNCGADMRGETE